MMGIHDLSEYREITTHGDYFENIGEYAHIFTGEVGKVSITQNYNISIQANDKQIQEKIVNKEKIIERLRETLKEKDVTIQSPLVVHAKNHWDIDGWKEIEGLLLQSLERHLTSEEYNAAASDAFNLGSIKELQADYQQARTFYEQSVLLEPQNSWYLNNLGIILHGLKEYQKAIGCFEQAKILDIQKFEGPQLNVAILLNNIAECYANQKQYDKAKGYYQQSLDIKKRIFSEEHVSVARTLNNLGMLYFRQENYRDAEKFLRKALTIFADVLGSEHALSHKALLSLVISNAKQKEMGEIKRLIQNFKRGDMP